MQRLINPPSVPDLPSIGKGERLVYNGSNAHRANPPSCYSMAMGNMPLNNLVPETRDDTNRTGSCNLHSHCAGHIGYKCKPGPSLLVSHAFPDELMYPAAMCDHPGLYVNADTSSRAKYLSHPCEDGGSRKEYESTIIKSLQTKGGLLRNDIMGARVEGSCRLTISPSVQRAGEGPNAGSSEVVVPLHFANQVRIPSYSSSFNQRWDILECWSF